MIFFSNRCQIVELLHDFYAIPLINQQWNVFEYVVVVFVWICIKIVDVRDQSIVDHKIDK